MGTLRDRRIEPLLKKLLGTTDLRRLRGREVASLAAQFAEISASDYLCQLREHFSAREIRGVVAAMEWYVPGFNRRPLRETSLSVLCATAEELKVGVKAFPFGRELEDLRGFYVPSPAARKRPTIWLNTRYDRIAVASSFWHEMGHHLVDRLGEKAKSMQLMFRDDFSAHMSDPAEMIADTMVALACYPKNAALGLFGTHLKSDREPSPYELVIGARRHLNAVADFEFEKEFPAGEHLYALAGMLHYAKLRWALLAEFWI